MAKNNNKLSKIKIYSQDDAEKYRALVPYKKKNYKKIVIPLIIIVMLAILALYFLLNFVFVGPDTVFKKAINEIKIQIDSEKNIKGFKSAKAEFDLKFNIEQEDSNSKFLTNSFVNFLNKFNLSVKAEKNFNKPEMKIDLNLYDDSEQFDIKSVVKNEKMFLLVNELFDKYITIDFDNNITEKLFFGFENKYVYALSTILDSLSKSLKGEYFEQYKNNNITKNTIILDNNNVKNIITYVLNDIKDQDIFLNTLAEYEGISTSDAKSKIYNLIEKIATETIIEEGKKIEVSIFTEGITNVNKLQIDVVKNDKVEYSLNITYIDNGKYEFNININNQKITGNIEFKDENEYEIVNINIFSAMYGKIQMKIRCNIQYNEELIKISDLDDAISIKDLKLSNTEKILKNIKNSNIALTIMEIVNGNNFDIDNLFYDVKANSNYTTNDDKTVKNIVKKDGISVEFNICNGYIYDSKYSSEAYKYFDNENLNSQVYVSITNENEKKYFDNIRKSDYEHKVGKDESYYSNVNISDVLELKLDGDALIKYLKLSYNAGTKNKYEKIYAIYSIDEKHSYIVEIESKNSSISDDVLKSFASIKVK